MRYYDLQIFNTDGSIFAQYTTQYNGQPNPNALMLELDVPVSTLANPVGYASLKLWGVSLQTIGQASDFNGKGLKLYAGMQKGLPLANPAQAGLILEGTIYQSFGNWVNTDQWVEFVVTSDSVPIGANLNITWDCPKGQQFSVAIRQTLKNAVHSLDVDVEVSSNLVLATHEVGVYGSLTQFAQYLKTASAQIVGGAYTGVDVLIRQNSFIVRDGTTSTDPLNLNFQDLIGQPTWIDPGTIQITTVMRADLSVFDYVVLPQGQYSISPSDPRVSPSDKSVFQGAFVINEVRHVGNSRQASAASWVTTFNCSPSSVQ